LRVYADRTRKEERAHLSAQIAKALGARANELFAVSPQIEKVEVLAATPLKG
jgi:hypothetical protein